MSVGSSTPQAAASRVGSAGTRRHGGGRGLRFLGKSERIATNHRLRPQRRRRDRSRLRRPAPTSRSPEPGRGNWSIRAAGFRSGSQLDGCATEGEVCGELEYGDPSGADQVFCASELTRTGLKGDVLALGERIVYHPSEVHGGRLRSAHLNRREPRNRAGRVRGTGTVCARERSPTIGDTLPAAPAAALAEGSRVSAGRRQVRRSEVRRPSTPPPRGQLISLPLEDRGQVARVNAASGEIRR